MIKCYFCEDELKPTSLSDAVVGHRRCPSCGNNQPPLEEYERRIVLDEFEARVKSMRDRMSREFRDIRPSGH